MILVQRMFHYLQRARQMPSSSDEIVVVVCCCCKILVDSFETQSASCDMTKALSFLTYNIHRNEQFNFWEWHVICSTLSRPPLTETIFFHLFIFLCFFLCSMSRSSNTVRDVHARFTTKQPMYRFWNAFSYCAFFVQCARIDWQTLFYKH